MYSPVEVKLGSLVAKEGGVDEVKGNPKKVKKLLKIGAKVFKANSSVLSLEAQVRSDAPTKDEEHDTIDEKAQKLTKQLVENMNDVLEMNLLQFGNKFDLKARHFMEELEGVIRGNSDRVISYLGYGTPFALDRYCRR